MADYFEDFKPIKNRLRKINVFDVIEQLHRLLNKCLPEVIEFIYVNALIYSTENNSGPNYIKDIEKSLNATTELLNKVHALSMDDGVFDWLRRMALNQIKGRVRGLFTQLFRYYTIFSDATIAKHIEQKIGMPYYDFFICSFWIYSKFHGDYCVKESYLLTQTEGVFRSENILRALKILSIPYVNIRERLKSQVVYNEDVFIFYNQQHIKTPIIRHNGHLICLYKDVLLRQITGGMYYYAEIFDKKNNLNNQFGKGFERYIGLILSKLNTSGKRKIIPEISYGISKNKGHNRTSDWIVIDDSSIAFIECKAKRQILDYKRNSTSHEVASQVLDGVSESIVQIYKSYNDYRLNRIPDLPFDKTKQFIPIVVFLEDGMYIDTDDSITTLVKRKLIEAGIDATVVDDCPFQMSSADDFEYNVQLMFHFGFASYLTMRKSGELTRNFEEGYEYVDYFSDDFTKLFIDPNK